MTQPLFSVLINNYNFARFVGDAIECVRRQTCQDFELIVVDDGSKDNSVDVIRKTIAPLGHRGILIEKDNGGQASAMNAAAARATGKYWAFLDSDDLWDPGKLAVVAKWFGLCKKAAIIQHNLRILLPSGMYGREFPGTGYHGWPINHFRNTQGLAPFVPTSGITVRGDLARLVFPLPENYRLRADVPLTRTMALLGETRTLPRTLGYYVVHNQNNWYSNLRTRTPDEAREETRSIVNPLLTAAGLAPIPERQRPREEWEPQRKQFYKALPPRERWSRKALNSLYRWETRLLHRMGKTRTDVEAETVAKRVGEVLARAHTTVPESR